MKYIVYCTINIKNKKFYVGTHKTENPEVFDNYYGCGIYSNRPSSYLHPSTAFQYAFKKYGVSAFYRMTLAVFDTSEEAYKLEAQIVTKEFINRKDTYNMTVGGQEGNINDSSVEKPVYKFDLKGNFLEKYDTTTEAVKSGDYKRRGLQDAMETKNSYRGYLWSRSECINIDEYTVKAKTVCYKYDGNTKKLIETYNSVSDAAKEFDVSYKVIRNAIVNHKSYKGYYYSNKLYDEYIIPKNIHFKTTPIYVYDKEGNYITSLLGNKEIYQYFNIKGVSLVQNAINNGNCLRDKQITLEYKDKLPIYKENPKKSRIVNVYTKEGNFIESFESTMKARAKYGTGVTQVLRGKRKLCKGFIFKYADEEV